MGWEMLVFIGCLSLFGKSLDPTNQYEATQSYTKLQSYILRLRSLRELICSLDKYGKVMQS